MCDGLDWMDGNTQSYLRMGLDWIGLDGMGWLSYTAVTPRASLQSDANNILGGARIILGGGEIKKVKLLPTGGPK